MCPNDQSVSVLQNSELITALSVIKTYNIGNPPVLEGLEQVLCL